MSSGSGHSHRQHRRSVWAVVWTALGVAGLAGWCLSFAGGDAARVWRALLVSFLFFTPLAGGMVVWTAVLKLAHGRWEGPLRWPAMAGLGFAPASLLALLALWIGSPHWVPWPSEATLPQGVWLQPTFVFARDLVALLAFWAVAAAYVVRRRRNGGTFLAVTLVLVYAVAFSLVGFDLGMSLDTRWHSTLFGLYIAVAAWTLISLSQPGITRDRMHDQAKLTVAFSLMTTYLMFSQLLPIWYENLPDERTFVIARMNFLPWNAVSVALLAVVYLGPLVMLLTLKSKRDPRRLGAIMLLLLVGLWVERWWLVEPSFTPHLQLGLAEVSMAAALLGAFGLSFRRALPLVRPAEGKEAREVD
jgi:hypothetical protein